MNITLPSFALPFSLGKQSLRSVLLAGALGVTSATGAIFVQPVSVDADSGALYSEEPADRIGSKAGATEYTEDESYSAEVLFDRGGLDSSALDTVETIQALAGIDLEHIDDPGGNQGSVWFTENGTQEGTLVFDMGASFTEGVSHFILWTTEAGYYSEAGVVDFKLRFFDAAGNSVGGEFEGTAAGDTTADSIVSAQIFDLENFYTDVRYVEWEILTVVDSVNFDNYAAAHEIGFAAVPEPAGFGLLLGIIFYAFAVGFRRKGRHKRGV